MFKLLILGFDKSSQFFDFIFKIKRWILLLLIQFLFLFKSLNICFDVIFKIFDFRA